MCHGDDGRPPPPPVRGEVSGHGRATLQSADGTLVTAYRAHPEADSDVGVVILPDVRGLHRFYEELAVRFAEAGCHAVAIDYFGRTTADDDRGDDFAFLEHVQKLQPAQLTEDVAAAVSFLRGLDSGPIRSVFSVGFCMGGSFSWSMSATGLRIAGCIGFYGLPSLVADAILDMNAPLLVLAAGRDFTPLADVETFVDQARASGVDVELTVYQDAPHSFFDHAFAEHHQECDDAWERVLSFVARHRGGDHTLPSKPT